ncbi:energy-coupling factor ABC transporter ATP-binding protein [Bacillus sp. Hm123]|uniref:energy-coupling factor ABC transporter ATP-binding protein n=1 Tax=Bacillus sp. Hm123 TaxID=3450745 RepID=UPI003F444E61
MIQLQNVSFQYDHQSKMALQAIHLEISEGEVIVLCGKSGCGKTTITRLLNGLIPHYINGQLQGTIRLTNQDIQSLKIHEISKLTGSVFQNPKTQFYNIDTDSELVFTVENFGLPSEEILNRKATTVEQFGLQSLLNRNLFHLSGGEKQRIACASVAIHDPPIIILDEPSANLDPDATSQLEEMITLWKSQGKTIVISEHRLHYLQKLADRFVYLESGQIKHIFTQTEMRTMSKEALYQLGLRAIHLEKLIPVQDCFLDQNARFKLEALSYLNHDFQLNIEEFELPFPAIMAITGHNGAGKSTFAQSLTGLNKKASPTFYINDVKFRKKQCLQVSSIVMQDVHHQLFTESVLSEILLSMPEPNEEQALDLLSLLDAVELKDAHPMALSGGEKQRIAILSAMAADKQLIIMDEPTSGLDFHHMKQFAHCMNILRNQNKLVFIITHDPEMIALCCDGKIELAQGTIKNITLFNKQRGLEQWHKLKKKNLG